MLQANSESGSIEDKKYNIEDIVYDFLIVGAGVSGFYCAFRLLEKNADANILIVERLGRTGGRVYTSHFNDHVLEHGAMRFEPNIQPKFKNLIQELELECTYFSPYTCPVPGPDLNLLSINEIVAIRKNSDLHPGFALLKYALELILGDQWNVDSDDVHDPTRIERKSWLTREGTYQGRYLHDQGFWEVMATVLSKTAIDYLIMKGTFYHLICANPNAVDQITFMLDILATAKNHLITVKGGVNKIVDTLHDKVRLYKNAVILFETEFISYIDHHEGEDNVSCEIDSNLINVTLKKVTDNSFMRTRCKDLIFTCQQKAFNSISGFPIEIRHHLEESVSCIDLLKVFVVFKNPPFNEHSIPLANTFADKVPCRELHYDYDAVNKTGCVMLYTDAPNIEFWKSFTCKRVGGLHDGAEEAEFGDNFFLKQFLKKSLKLLFPNNDRELEIVHYSIMDWSANGVHQWKPGWKSHEASNKLASFGNNGRIHVCGETYSTFHFFIEGCITSVDLVLMKMGKN